MNEVAQTAWTPRRKGLWSLSSVRSGPYRPLQAPVPGAVMNLKVPKYAVATSPLILLQPITGNLNRPGYYIDWGPIQISAGNALMIAIGILLFVLAILIPFPKGKKRP